MHPIKFKSVDLPTFGSPTIAIGIPFFITGIDSIRHGQEVAIAVEKNVVSLKETNDLKKLFEKLGKLYSPKAILAIPHFVRTENGKIKRKESLRQTVMRIALESSGSI